METGEESELACSMDPLKESNSVYWGSGVIDRPSRSPFPCIGGRAFSPDVDPTARFPQAGLRAEYFGFR